MIRSPLSWTGGKDRLREKIVRRIPSHRSYVEVFAGAAWVLFGKDPSISKREVMNDLDGELINFWRVIKHRPAEFSERASWLFASRELWQEWKTFKYHEDELERAVRFYAVIKLGFGAQRIPTSFGSRSASRPPTWWAREQMEAGLIVARLRDVWIEHLDWRACIAKFDSRETFFYLDPPYRCAGSKAYALTFSDDDHRALAQTLMGKVHGKWLLSYNDDPFIRRLYDGRGIKSERLRVPYSIARSGRQTASELLIRNY